MCIILHQFGHFSDNSFQSYYPSSMLFLAKFFVSFLISQTETHKSIFIRLLSKLTYWIAAICFDRFPYDFEQWLVVHQNTGLIPTGTQIV